MAKYKHVLCLNPYLRESSAAMGFFPSIGLEYVASALEGHIDKVSLIDLRKDKEYRHLDRLREFIRREVDLLCVSVNWSYGYDEVCDLITGLAHDGLTVVGGQEATNNVEEILKRCPNVDVIVRGEGEESIQQIAQGMGYPDILGISYRQDGRIVHNPNRPLPPVEVLRNPNRKLRKSPYFISSKGISLNLKFDTVLSARGCPFNCKFCTFAVNPLGQKRTYSARSPESVVEEIKDLDANFVFFADDNFFVNPKRVERICDLLIEQGIQKRYIAHARLEIYKSPQMLEKAAKAGFKWLLIGIESPHDRTLKEMDKGFTADEVRRAFKVLRAYPFFYHCYFICGNIGETREEMLYIPEFALEIGADSISFQKLQARKFSPIIDIVKNRPDLHLDRLGFVYSDQYSISDLREIQRLIKRRFYTPKQIYKMLAKLNAIHVVTPAEFMGILWRTPAVLYRFLVREIEKKKTRRRGSGVT